LRGRKQKPCCSVQRQSSLCGYGVKLPSVLLSKLQLSATTCSERINSSQLWHCSPRCASAQHTASLQRAWRICRQCSSRGLLSGAASPAPRTAGVCWRPQACLQRPAVLSSTRRCTERRGSPRGQPATCGTAPAAAWRGTGALRRRPTRPAQPRRPCRRPQRSASAPRPAQGARATRPAPHCQLARRRDSPCGRPGSCAGSDTRATHLRAEAGRCACLAPVRRTRRTGRES